MTKELSFKEEYLRLGFDLIINEVQSNCQIQITQDRIQDLIDVPKTQLDYELNLTDSFKTVVGKGLFFRFDLKKDLFQILNKTEIEGAILHTEELYELKTALVMLNEIKNSALKTYKFGDNAYVEFCSGIDVNQFVLSLLEDTIDHNGNVKDDASPELFRIRTKIKKTQNFLTKRVHTIMLGAIKRGYSRDDAQPTIRNGRMVIPVRSENKRVLEGLPHGESGTGQTAYVEPKELFEHNNELQTLFEDERSEVRKILLQIVALIRDDKESLSLEINKLVLYDFYQSKAQFATKLNAVNPQFSDDTFNIIQGSNPLLLLKQGEDTVPFDLVLSKEDRVLLLTGPNAGGKSILLKSVGLLYMMYSHGILVPCDEESTFCLFDEVFVDIGDGQSIENELSTYSAHLKKMKYTLEKATENSLVLVDEFGTGTEPDYGAALAESILNELNSKKIKGVFTTHFNSLKEYAEKNEGVFNGAMLFNMETLSPTFLFKAGNPGSSFAFEIGKKLGLPERVLKEASSKLGKTRLKYDKALLELQDKNRQLHESILKNKRKEQNLNELKTNYQELKDNLEQRKDAIQLKAEKEALHLLKETQIELKRFKDKYKSSKPEQKPVVRKELEQKTEKLAKKLNVKPTIAKNPEVGDKVKHAIKGFEGEVVSIKNKQAVISNNGFEWKAKLSELAVLEGQAAQSKKKSSNVSGQLLEKRVQFNNDLDVRGKRTEEALKTVDQFIDDAIVLGVEQVRIIHGKGEGILRQMIRNQLQGTAHVGLMYDEHVDFGGAGITVVELN